MIMAETDGILSWRQERDRNSRELVRKIAP